jgi:hypothetical protein
VRPIFTTPQDTANTTNNMSNTTGPSQHPIPQLQSVAPSIFVPITTDLLAPFEPPRSRVERLRAILANLDEHHTAVGANLDALFDYERARIIHESRDTSQQQKLGEGEGPASITNEEADRMIASMEAQPDPNMPAALAAFPEAVELDQQRELTPSEVAAKEISRLLIRFSMDIKGFNAHVRKTRAFYEQALERELQIEAK